MKSHISYSALKDWKFCPYYHKISHIDKLRPFKGNEYTAFGTAIHTTYEKSLLEEGKHLKYENVFQHAFIQELGELSLSNVKTNPDLIADMYEQGKMLSSLSYPALKEKFGEDCTLDDIVSTATYRAYRISQGELDFGDLFRSLEENKEAFGLLDYSITQTTMDQVFKNFAKFQLGE